MHNSIKDATADSHCRAESTELVKLIFKKSITKQQYACLLANQLIYYSAIENHTNDFANTDLFRTKKIIDDLIELAETKLVIVDESYRYAEYIKTLSQRDLYAHIYVHYLGDMAGGQMIKRCIPGSGTRFDFVEAKLLVDQIRMNVSIANAVEANCGFDWTIKIYDKLYNSINDSSRSI